MMTARYRWAGVLISSLLLSANAAAQSGGLPTSVGSGVSRVGSGLPTQAGQQQPQSLAQPPQQQTQPQQQPQQQSQQRPAQQQQGQPQNYRPAPTPMGPVASPALNVNLVNEAIESSVPLTAEEIRNFRRELEGRKAAMSENVSGRPPPTPTTGIYNLDLSPGATPPVVRIEVGHGSIVSFLDAAGRPWPAKVADNFSPGGLTMSQFTEHQLSIGTTSSNPINVGVAVALEGVPTAITFSVISGNSIVDTQVHMVVPLYRNGAPPGVGSLRGEPSLTAGDLMSYLLRTPPASARKLTVEGLSGALAWQISSDRMVVRTTAMVTTGAFRVQGIGDGTFVYEMPLSPQVRIVQADKFSSLRISGFMTGGL